MINVNYRNWDQREFNMVIRFLWFLIKKYFNGFGIQNKLFGVHSGWMISNRLLYITIVYYCINNHSLWSRVPK